MPVSHDLVSSMSGRGSRPVSPARMGSEGELREEETLEEKSRILQEHSKQLIELEALISNEALKQKKAMRAKLLRKREKRAAASAVESNVSDSRKELKTFYSLLERNFESMEKLFSFRMDQKAAVEAERSRLKELKGVEVTRRMNRQREELNAAPAEAKMELLRKHAAELMALSESLDNKNKEVLLNMEASAVEGTMERLREVYVSGMTAIRSEVENVVHHLGERPPEDRSGSRRNSVLELQLQGELETVRDLQVQAEAKASAFEEHLRHMHRQRGFMDTRLKRATLKARQAENSVVRMSRGMVEVLKESLGSSADQDSVSKAVAICVMMSSSALAKKYLKSPDLLSRLARALEYGDTTITLGVYQVFAELSTDSHLVWNVMKDPEVLEGMIRDTTSGLVMGVQAYAVWALAENVTYSGEMASSLQDVILEGMSAIKQYNAQEVAKALSKGIAVLLANPKNERRLRAAGLLDYVPVFLQHGLESIRLNALIAARLLMSMRDGYMTSFAKPENWRVLCALCASSESAEITAVAEMFDLFTGKADHTTLSVLMDAGLIDGLMVLASSDNVRVLLHATRAIVNIASNSEMREHLYSETIIQQVASLLRSSDAEVCSLAIQAAAKLARGSDVRPLLVKCGIVTRLAKLLEPLDQDMKINHRERYMAWENALPAIRLYSIGALANISLDPEGTRHVMLSGAILSILMIMQTLDIATELLCVCLLAVGNVSVTDKGACVEAFDCGAMGSLRDVLATQSDDKVNVLALRILSSFIHNDVIFMEVYESGVVEMLVRFWRSKVKDVRRKATHQLNILAAVEQIKMSLLNDPLFVKYLQEGIYDKDHEVLTNVVSTTACLATSQANVQILVSQKIIPGLLNCLKSKEEELIALTLSTLQDVIRCAAAAERKVLSSQLKDQLQAFRKRLSHENRKSLDGVVASMEF
jgi:hypothetical protein